MSARLAARLPADGRGICLEPRKGLAAALLFEQWRNAGADSVVVIVDPGNLVFGQHVCHDELVLDGKQSACE